MQQFPLAMQQGHLLMSVSGGAFLLDTDAPSSFGSGDTVGVDGRVFGLLSGSLGLSAEGISECVGAAVAGLIGSDILNGFDALIDVPAGYMTLSADVLSALGDEVALDAFMGIPTVSADILGIPRRCKLVIGSAKPAA
jgi:hypothetical protein